MITEVSSIESQSKETTDKVKSLQAKWKELSGLPSKESEKLSIKFRKACDKYFDKVKEAIEEREWNQFANLAAKEKLITELEALKGTEDPVELSKLLKEKQSAWKEIGPVPMEKSDEVWGRLKQLVIVFMNAVKHTMPSKMKFVRKMPWLKQSFVKRQKL